MGCCNGRNWQREEKADHRFDYLDMKSFHTNLLGCRLGHMYVWIATFRSMAVLAIDLYTAVGLLVLKSYSTTVTQQTFIAHHITKWIFGGCIILSVVLLIWDWYVAIRIIRSKNISFAFTNVIANRWYSLSSYDHHCLFYKLSSSSHRSNNVTFWVFFSFIGWKRLLFSEGPRQVINALTVVSVASTRQFSIDAAAYADITPFQWTVLSFMALSLLIWLFSFVRFFLAAVLFLPLLCHLQGGLTEFVVRKIDKRIEQIIEKARHKRLERYKEAREAQQHPANALKKKTGLQRNKSILTERPTLPSISLVDDEKALMLPSIHMDDKSSIHSIDSMTKSNSAYSLSTFAGGPPRTAETLPLYRPRTNESYLAPPRQPQTEPTLPVFRVDSDTSPRMQSSSSLSHTGARLPRPFVQAAPSYHRQDSTPFTTNLRTVSAGQTTSSVPRYREQPLVRPSTVPRPPPRQVSQRELTNASLPGAQTRSFSNHSNPSHESLQSTQSRPRRLP